MLPQSFVAALTLAIVATTPSMAGPPKIIQKVIPGGFKITIIDFVGGDENAAQAMIAPTVRQLCGQLTPRWGRFALKAVIAAPKGKALKPGRFEQDITCIKPPAIESNAPTGPFTATESDEKLVRDAALNFLRLRDVGKGEDSFALLSPSMRESTDRVTWVREVGAKPATIRGGVVRRIAKVTWYVDPPGVPTGVYAAADFDGYSSGLAIHCGYVALKRQPSGDYLVVRMEEGQLTSGNAKGLTAEKMLEMRGSLQCRN